VAKALRDELRRRLNSPAVVNPFPLADYPERKDAAVRQWVADLFELYDIAPTGETAWEQLAWRLAVELFPHFRIVAKSNVGAPDTRDAVTALVHQFEAFQPRLSPRQGGKGSKYKQFLDAHSADCAAAKIKTEGALKDAVYRSRKRIQSTRFLEEQLVRFETMKALGLLRSDDA
jgi:hypothetical protein